MFCRRAAPRLAAPGTPLPRLRSRPRQARRPARPRRVARKGPTFGTGGAARENARPPENGPRWPGRAAVSAARKHSAVCAARAPGRPPPPEAQLAPARAAPAPRRCAAPPPRRPAGPRPRTPTLLAPRRPSGWPSPRGVPPGGSQSLGATGWRPRPPLTQKKPQSNRGLTPPGKDGEADGQGWHCPGWTACRLRAKE